MSDKELASDLISFDKLTKPQEKEKKRLPIKFISRKVKNLKKETQSLRHISRRVRDIMNRNKTENYKTISDEITKLFQLDEKESKNIKRRIYDALNVIKATNIDNMKLLYDKEKSVLDNLIKKKNETLRFKFISMQQIEDNLKCIKDHITKNEKMSNMEEYLKSQKEEKIYFPFIIVEHTNSCDCYINLTMSNSKKRFLICCNKSMNIYGDLQLLRKIYKD